MCLGWIKKRLQMNRLWIKKEKMAAHPIAEASITLYLSPSVSVSDRGQSAGQSSSQSGERGRERRRTRRRGGGSPPLAPRMLCNCCKQTDRVTEGLTHIRSRIVLRTLAVIPHSIGTRSLRELHRSRLNPTPTVSTAAGRASL